MGENELHLEASKADYNLEWLPSWLEKLLYDLLALFSGHSKKQKHGLKRRAASSLTRSSGGLDPIYLMSLQIWTWSPNDKKHEFSIHNRRRKGEKTDRPYKRRRRAIPKQTEIYFSRDKEGEDGIVMINKKTSFRVLKRMVVCLYLIKSLWKCFFFSINSSIKCYFNHIEMIWRL